MAVVYYPIIKKVEGGGSGGGASFNIHYGLNPPEDTSMLWVETEREPSGITFGNKLFADGVSLIDTAEVTAIQYCASAVVGTKIYYLGGTTNKYVNTIHVYDTTTSGFETLTVGLPANVGDASAVAIGTKIYLFGGRKSSSSYNTNIYVFDTEQETVSTLGVTLPSKKYYMGITAYGTKIYLFGGFNGTSCEDVVWSFDTTTNEFNTLTDVLTSKCSSIAVANVGTKAYLFGGSTSGSNSSGLNHIHVFNFETERLDKISVTLPGPLCLIGATSVGTKIYLFGGGLRTTSSEGRYARVFDTETLEFTNIYDFGEAGVYGLCADAVDGKIYLYAGNRTTIGLFAIEASDLEYNKAYALISTYKNVFRLIGGNTSLDIGVVNVNIGNENNKAQKVTAYLYNGTKWEEI